MDKIIEKLDRLDNLQAQLEVLKLRKAVLIDQATPPEVRQAIAEIDDEFHESLQTCMDGIASLETEIKNDVMLYGQSIKAEHLQAVWNKGRVSWDTKALDGYAAAHPEIEKFRKENDPSVSIRRVK